MAGALDLSRANVTSYVGNMAQIGGHRQVVLDNGTERGVRVIEVSTGPGGLRYDVVIDRGADIGGMWYGEIPLTWISRTGYRAPAHHPDHGTGEGLGWLKGFFGGGVTTCGPYNVGAPCEDYPGEKATGKKVRLGLHDQYSNTPASLRVARSEWKENGDYVTEIEADVLPAKVFGHDLQVRRRITSGMGSPKIVIRDVVENVGNESSPHQWLYHCQGGWPVLAEGARIVYAARSVTPRCGNDELSPVYFAEGNPFREVSAPLDAHRGGGEVFAYIDPGSDGGIVSAAFINSALGLGLRFGWSAVELPRLGNWIHLGPGEYTSGIEPMSKGSGVQGRNLDREAGRLEFLEPAETRTYNLGIDVLSGEEEIMQYLERKRRLDPDA